MIGMDPKPFLDGRYIHNVLGELPPCGSCGYVCLHLDCVCADALKRSAYDEPMSSDNPLGINTVKGPCRLFFTKPPPVDAFYSLATYTSIGICLLETSFAATRLVVDVHRRRWS